MTNKKSKCIVEQTMKKTKILEMMENVEITQWYLILINRCPSRRFRPDKEDGVVEVRIS